MSYTEAERVDDDEGGVGVLARLSLAIGHLAESNNALRAHLERPIAQPVFRPLGMAGPAPAAGLLAFNLGGPALGRSWHVRTLVVGGQTPTTAAAGKADVFAANVTPGVGAPLAGDQPGSPGFYSPSGFAAGCLLNWRDTFTALPAPHFYSYGELMVAAGQQLWVVINGGTSGQVYQAAGVAEDYPDAAYTVVRT